MKLLTVSLFKICMLLGFSTTLFANPLLTIIHDGESKSYEYDEVMAMDITSFKTSTPWTEEVVTFAGPSLKYLLKDIQTAQKVTLTALNGYSVSIEFDEAKTLDSILAVTSNGKALTVRNRGPIWMVFPWSDQEKYQNQRYNDFAIWQLSSLTIE